MPNPAGTARSLAVLCLASLFWAFSFGLGAPLASLWLQNAGCNDTLIGLNTGVYYSGIAVAAVFVPALMRRWGRGCPVVGMVVSGVAVALFPWGGGMAGWFTLRFINGVAGAMSLIPVETLVNHRASPEQRSRDFGFYAFSVALGMALGTLVGLQLNTTVPHTAFVIGGLLAVLAGMVVLCWLPFTAPPAEERHERTALPLGQTFLSWGSAWSQGFLEGGMVALLPIFLIGFGLNEDGVSWLMSGIMIGVIVFQVPIAWLADRWGRTTVLVGCYLVTAAALVFLPWCKETAWLAAALFAAGACSGAFYPLGLALLGERLPPAAVSRASALYLAINCVGSLTGPVITGIVMDLCGRQAMFWSGEAAIVVVLLVWIGIRRNRRRAEASALAVESNRQAA